MDDIRLDGKTTIITGAARGLGRAYALDIARAGGNVVLNDVSRDALELVAAEVADVGGQARIHDESIVAPGAAERLVALAVDHFGRVDGLVNNAGLRPEGPAWGEDPGAVRAAVEVNLLGAIFCGIAALGQMRSQGFGSVINVSSRAQSGIPESATYSATKGAVATLTYSWAIDLREYGVRVNAIAPQASGTGTRRESTTRPGEPTPDEMAPLVRYLLSDRSTRVTGQVIRIGRPGAGATRLALMTPPRTAQSYSRDDGWSAEALAEFFDTTLGARLEPFGAVPVNVAWATTDAAADGTRPDVEPWQ